MLTRLHCCRQNPTAVVLTITILFIIIHTSKFGVLLDFNFLLCEDNCVSFSFLKTLYSQSCSLNLLDDFVVIVRQQHTC